MCECKRTVLIVENDAGTMETNLDLFTQEGYNVFVATNPQEAKECVEKEVIDLAVIDVRLENDKDQEDFSGMYLAAELPTSICMVITTGQKWSDLKRLYDYVFRRNKEGRRIAYDFIMVEDARPAKVLEAVRTAFDNDIRINAGLNLKTKPDSSWEKMVGQLKMYRNGNNGARQESEQEARERGVEQLKDLTCRLFSIKKTVPSRVVFLSTTPGYSPCTVAIVRPTFGKVDGVELAVKFGPRKSIEQEVQNGEQWVEPHIQSSTRLAYGPVWSRVWSREMGALAYTFVGDNGKTVDTLRTIYKNDALISSEALCDILEDLFAKTCARWYAGKENILEKQPEHLDTLYREQLNLSDVAQVKKLEDTVKQLIKESSSGRNVFKLLRNGQLQVHLGERTKLLLHDPLKFCFEKHCSVLGGQEHRSRAKAHNFFPVTSQYAITHGDLHASNVIVNKERRTWLIDFYKTGVGHILRDFAEMESDIKFTLFGSKSLNARYQLEKALLAPRNLHEEIALDSNPSPQQTRALAAIQRLRQLAFKLTDIGDTREYYMALLFYALKSISGFTSGSGSTQDRSAAQHHALLSAALICQRLSSSSPDKEGTVFLAHAYGKRYRNLIYSGLKSLIQKLNYDVAHPLDQGAGQLWERTAAMIEDTEAGFYEITTRNGNVYFELGCALGLRKPYFPLIERKNQNPLKRPPLLGGELVQDYIKEDDLNRRVQQILEKRNQWKDWFFFMKPEFEREAKRNKPRLKSAFLIVANTPRSQRRLVSILKRTLEIEYGWRVEVVHLYREVDIEKFYLKMLKVELVVGCFSSARGVSVRYANAELALALGIAYGMMEEKPIMLQPKKGKVLTDLISLTTTFDSIDEVAESLRKELNARFPRRVSKRKSAGSKDLKPRIVSGGKAKAPSSGRKIVRRAGTMGDSDVRRQHSVRKGKFQRRA